MVYYVLEFQTNDGVGAVLVNQRSSYQEACQTYHHIMSSASVSQVAKHGAMIITEDMYIFDGKKELAYRPGEQNE